MISKRMALRKKDSAVSPVIATILMVAITVVLAAVLYVMVGGFTHNPGTANSAGLNEAQNSANNYTVTVSSVSASNIPVTNLKVVISGAGFSGSATLSTGKWVALGTPLAVEYTQLSTGLYLSAGDTIQFGPATGQTVSSLSGATITLYNGNSQLGTVTL